MISIKTQFNWHFHFSLALFFQIIAINLLKSFAFFFCFSYSKCKVRIDDAPSISLVTRALPTGHNLSRCSIQETRFRIVRVCVLFFSIGISRSMPLFSPLYPNNMTMLNNDNPETSTNAVALYISLYYPLIH